MADSRPDPAAEVRRAIRDIPDFPQPGIVFKDITPLLTNAGLFARLIDDIAERFRSHDIEYVCAIEARGFIFGAPIAKEMGAGFIPIRKPGKLPYKALRVDYDLEYGSDSLEAHEDALTPGARVLLVDDVLATGGTAAAAATLIHRLGGQLVAACFVVELGFLGGREKLGGLSIESVVTY